MTKKERFLRLFQAYDFVLVGLVLLLCVLGVVFIGSATGLGDGEISTEFTAQIMWLVSGIAVLFIVSIVDYQFLCRFYIPLACIAIVLLVVVLMLPPPRPNFPKRWIYLFRIGTVSPSIQPAEFAKLFMIIFFAKFIDKMQDKTNNLLIIAFMLITGLLPVILIFIQPSLSASILQITVLIVMLYLSGIRYKIILIGFAIVIPLALFFNYDIHREEHLLLDKIFETYQLETRIKPHFGINVTADNVYQSRQALLALGSGQLLGKGLFNNVVTVPLLYNDFIFAIIGAEFGFIGCAAVLILIFMVVLKCFAIAGRSDSVCGKLIAAGVGSMLAVQAFVHAAVSTNLIPNTGIPFPFVSAGGSSMWINFAAIGMVINVGMKPAKSTIFLD